MAESRPPGHRFRRDFVKPALFFVAHLSTGCSARSGEARAPQVQKKEAMLDQSPNLLDLLISFSRGLWLLRMLVLWSVVGFLRAKACLLPGFFLLGVRQKSSTLNVFASPCQKRKKAIKHARKARILMRMCVVGAIFRGAPF